MKNEQMIKRFIFKPTIIYLIFGLLALCLRLYFNFSQELIPGANGGYYPLQVRSVLTNGHLGFSDMPLIFYLNAFIIKIISFFGFPTTDNLILNVVKVIDSLSIPLLLIPLYKIIHLTKQPSSIIFEVSIIAFSVLSLSPLILLSDFQKNALAIVFLFCFFAYFPNYLHKKGKMYILLSFLFLLLTGLTHFGTFIFAVFIITIVMLYLFRKKALFPLIIIIIASSGLVAIFDLTRFNRLLTFGNSIFERPALLNGMLVPPDFLNIFISVSLVIIGAIALKRSSSILTPYQKAVIISSMVCLTAFSFPLLDGDYFGRFGLFLFIPQLLLIIQIAPVISVRQLKTIGIFLLLFTLLSILGFMGRPKPTVIDQTEFENLKELNYVIENDKETIIIAKHGLEWWTAWALHTKVGQDKAIDKTLFEKYKNVIFLIQIKGFGNDSKKMPFHEPSIPPNAELIYSSDYFKAFQLRHIDEKR